jgi:hypothetical protein
MTKIRAEISATVGIVATIMVAAGWMLTWARLTALGVPSDVVLQGLPTWFLIDQALQSLLAPMAAMSTLGVVWLVLAGWSGSKVRDVQPHPRIVFPDHATSSDVAGHLAKPNPARRAPALPALYQWALFGLTLSGASVLGVHLLATDAGHRRGYWGWMIVIAVVGVAVTVGVGRIVHWVAGWRSETSMPTEWGALMIAGTLIACFLTVSGLRIINARESTEVLPYAQVLVNQPCDSITAGLAESSMSSRAGRCLVGAFYLADTTDRIYLAQQSCGKQPSHLVVFRQDQIRQVVLQHKRFSCPRDGHGATVGLEN